MPVASLLDMFHIVGIPDEMESIFNVALYNTTRYTPHNLQECIHPWIQKYFIEWNEVLGVRKASTAKTAVMNRGSLTAVLDTDIVFGGDRNMALNHVFHTMLTWFRARYKIMRYEQQSSQNRDKTGGQTHAEDCPAPLPRMKFFIPVPEENPIEEPTKEDYGFASAIATHDTVKALFRYALSKLRWPESETWQDHLAVYPAPELAMPFASHLSPDVTTSCGFWHSPDATADVGTTGAGPAAKSAKLRLPPKSAAGGRRVKTAKNIQLAFIHDPIRVA